MKAGKVCTVLSNIYSYISFQDCYELDLKRSLICDWQLKKKKKTPKKNGFKMALQMPIMVC